MHQRPTPYRGWREVEAEPLVGHDSFSGEALMERVKAMLARMPGWEAHITLKLPGIGYRSVARWFDYAALEAAPGRLMEIVFDSTTYDGVTVVEDATDFGEGGEEITAIEGANIFFQPKQVLAGGCRLRWNDPQHDELNDCLLMAIRQAFCAHTPKQKRATEKVFLELAAFKAFLGVGEHDKVPLDRVQLLEPLLATRISVQVQSADGTPQATGYDGNPKYARRLRLTLKNEHYEFVKQSDCGRSAGPRAPAGRPRVFLDSHGTSPVGGAVEAMNAETRAQLLEDRRKPLSARRLIIPQTYGSLEEYMEIRAQLMSATGGLDLDQYGGSLKRLALEFFRLRSLLLPASPPLLALEVQMLGPSKQGGAARGGVIIAAPGKDAGGWTGFAVQYDVVSFYPSLLVDSHTLLPLNEGKATTLPTRTETGVRKFYPFGVFRARVSAIPEHFRPLWTQPYERFACFTHYDLSAALLLGATIELEEDGKPNALLWGPADRIDAASVFRGYVEPLFAAKREGKKAAKQALNILTGALYERKRCKTTFTQQEIADRVAAGDLLDPPGEMLRAFRLRDGGLRVETPDKSAQPYAGPYPRFGPFLTARGRFVLTKMLAPVVESGVRVVRCHTDGVLLEGMAADHSALSRLIGSGLGQLRLEKSGKCHCEGLRKPVWD